MVGILLSPRYIILKLHAFYRLCGQINDSTNISIKIVLFTTLFGSNISASDQTILEKIGDQYMSQVKPLIEKNCLSCHGNHSLNTWYRDLPIFQNYINSQIGNAKEKLDMGDGFPFSGKGKQSDIFWSIFQSIKLDKMPPKDFSFMHQNLELSKDDKTFLMNWFKTKRKVLLENDI